MEVALRSSVGAVLTALAGDETLARRVVRGDAVEHVVAPRSRPITRLVIEVQPKGPGVLSAVPPSEGGGAPSKTAVGSSDPVRPLEDLLLALVPSATGTPSPKRPDASLIRRIDDRLNAKVASSGAVPPKSEQPSDKSLAAAPDWKAADAAFLAYPLVDSASPAVRRLGDALDDAKRSTSAEMPDGLSRAVDALERVASNALDGLVGGLPESHSVRHARTALRAVFEVAGSMLTNPAGRDAFGPALRHAVLDARTARRLALADLAAESLVDARSGTEAPRGEAGALLRRICWTAARDEQAQRDGEENRRRVTSLLQQFDAPERLLATHALYKLQVTTRQTNDRIDPREREWPHVAYFRTAGPPGDFVAPVPPAARDALDTLALYLRATTPADGASEVFTGYGVGVVFNRPYVADFYALPGQNFRIKLLGPDGVDARALDIDLLRGSVAPLADTAWGSADRATQLAHETLLRRLLDPAGCGADLAPDRPDAVATASPRPGVVLAPRTKYTAVVEAGARGHEREVARFGFTTGRFRDFTDLVRQARVLGPIVTTPAAAFAVPSRLRDATPFDPALEGAAYLGSLGDVGLAPRTLPQQLQTTLLEVAGRAILVLLEFPQPIDMRRLGIEVEVVSDVDPRATLVATGAESTPRWTGIGDRTPPGLGGVGPFGAPVGDARASLADPDAVRRGSSEPTSSRFTPRVLRGADGVGLLLAAPDLRDLAGQQLTLRLTYSAAVREPERFPDEPSLVHGGLAAETATFAVRHRRPS